MGIRFILTLIFHVGSIQFAYSSEKRRRNAYFDLCLAVAALQIRGKPAETGILSGHHYVFDVNEIQKSETTKGPAYLLNAIEQRYDHTARLLRNAATLVYTSLFLSLKGILMKKLIPLFAFVFIVGTLPLLSGCGKPADPGAQGAAESAKPLGPDESILAMLNGVNNQQMEAVWNFLPASYQQDVNGIAHEFASKMDPEMYNGTFETGQRLAKLLKDKKEYILKNQMIQGLPVPPEKMDEFWDPTTNIISALVNSDLSSLDKLKSFDGGKFLSTTGNQLAKSVMALSSLVPQKEGEPSFSEKLKQTKVTVVTTEGETATIKIEAPGEEPKEEQMVKVEGKWIPKNLADNWDAKMADVRKKLADLTPEQVTAQKEQTLAGIKQVNETLAKLENAKSEEEFNKTLSPILAPVAMTAAHDGRSWPWWSEPGRKQARRSQSDRDHRHRKEAQQRRTGSDY